MQIMRNGSKNAKTIKTFIQSDTNGAYKFANFVQVLLVIILMV